MMENEISQLIEALRQDGVEKGRQEAKGIVAQAKGDAARIIEDARCEAERIIEAAEGRAKETMDHLSQQMALALRDLILKARTELEELLALRPLRREVGKAMADPEFVKRLIAAIATEYAKTWMAKEARQLRVEIPEEMKDEFMKNWVAMMRTELKAPMTLHMEKGIAGFGLSVEGGGGKLVMDDASIMDAIRPFVSERFHRLIDEAMAGAEAHGV
jgi:V/A-type H+-transporting ATPase subunit E